MKIVVSGGPRFYPNPDGNNCYTVPDCATYATPTSLFASAPAGIAKGSSGLFRLIIGDVNLNELQGGTKITVTASSIASVPTNTTTPTNSITVTPSEFTILEALKLSCPLAYPTVFEFTVSVPPDATSDSTTITVEVITPNGTEAKASIKVPITP